jgi:ferrous iron transport protein B
MIVFSLYLLGILMAILTGFCLRKTLLRGPASPLLIELPSYHLPRASSVGREMLWRLKNFLWRAGKVILPVCVVLSALNALSWEGGVHFVQGHEASLLSTIGQFLTPLFSPMGLRQENWPATVGLISGMLAKEVVIASLNALYTDQMSFLLQGSFDVIASLKAALWSIPQHFMTSTAQPSFLNQRLLASFNGPVGAYAYLLFILLYLPCVSTMAVIRQEANTYWMAFSIAWSFLLAYALAVLFYQGATLKLHPWQTLSCLALVVLLFTALIFILGRIAQTRLGGSYALANP